jgi:anti-sigma B factor antagonist
MSAPRVNPATPLSARELEAVRGPVVTKVTRDGDTVVVALRGQIDLFNVDSIRARIELEPLGRQATIILDLSRVEALDPTALRVLLAAGRRLDWREVVAVAPRQSVRAVLTSSELERIVPVYDALESVRRAGGPMRLMADVA